MTKGPADSFAAATMPSRAAVSDGGVCATMAIGRVLIGVDGSGINGVSLGNSGGDAARGNAAAVGGATRRPCSGCTGISRGSTGGGAGARGNDATVGAAIRRPCSGSVGVASLTKSITSR